MRTTIAAFVLLLLPSAASAASITEAFWYYSTVSSSIAGPLLLRSEVNYDDTRSDAPIAVVMHGYSPTNGNLDAVRAQAQRLRDAGFFSISVAMRGRDGSGGTRDSGGLEIHDIYDAVESVKEEYLGFVDPTNVHITGYSGGGGNVMSALVRFPDYFRLGSSFFGMSDYGFDPVDGWYNNGAGGRTSTLDQDIGNPNLADPDVLDRYRARASNLAASNSRYVEVHLFVNDNETICPLVNHQSFAQIGGAHVTSHVGQSAAPVFEDFNGNGIDDPNERQYWPHGFPSADQQAAAELWYRDRLLAGMIPEPEIDAVGTLVVPGFLRTKSFEVWPGDGQDATGILSYSLGSQNASFETELVGNDLSVSISLVVHSDFLEPAGAEVNATVNGEWTDSFAAGARRVFTGLQDGDQVQLSVAVPVSTGLDGFWSGWLLLLGMAGFAYRHLPRSQMIGFAQRRLP